MGGNFAISYLPTYLPIPIHYLEAILQLITDNYTQEWIGISSPFSSIRYIMVLAIGSLYSPL